VSREKQLWDCDRCQGAGEAAPAAPVVGRAAPLHSCGTTGGDLPGQPSPGPGTTGDEPLVGRAGAGARAHPFLRHRDARSDARWPRCRQDRRRDDRAPRRSRRIGGHGDARDRCHDADRRVAPRRSHPSRARLWCCRSPASRVSSSKRFLAGGQPKGLRLAWRTCGPWARYSGLRANEAAPQSSFAWYKPANEATKLFAWTGRPTRKPCAPSQSAERRNLS